MADDQAARQALIAEWTGFCERLRKEGQGLLEGSRGELTSQELAEGIRHLGRLAVHSLHSRVEFGDPDFPRFHRVCDDRNRWGAPHADNTYLLATLRGDATYLVRGHTYGRLAVFGRLLWNNAPDFRVEPDGSFKITLSADKAVGNWIQLDRAMRGDAGISGPFPGLGGHLMIKIYHDDWASEAPMPWMTIDRIDAEAPAMPPPLSPGRLAGQMKDAGELFTQTWDFYEEHQNLMHGMVAPNVLAPPVPAIIPKLKPELGGTVAPLVYGFGYFQLAEHEALLIESEVPSAGQWAFQLYDRWYESLEFQNRQTNINKRQAYIDADGKFRAIISREDPGAPNWLDTNGLQRGWVLYRWLHTEIRPTAKATVIAFKDRWRHLPSDHPQIQAQARRQALAERDHHLARRFQQ